jgi:hypothetical protein
MIVTIQYARLSFVSAAPPGPKQSVKEWVKKCRQPLRNETSEDGKTVTTPYGGPNSGPNKV